jgi:hypothetical protein
MRHFDLTRWVDYAHGLLPPEERAPMDAHLQQGCEECGMTAALFGRVASTAASNPNFDVPADLIDAALAIFPAKLTEVGLPWRTLIAKLSLDGFAATQPLGARAGNAAAHLMFEAEDYSVDLREEAEPNSLHCSLIGQVARRSDPPQVVTQVPVLLLAGDTVVARSLTNNFGEFCLEYLPQSNLRLAIAVETAGVRIEVPLNKLTGA